MVEQRVKRLPVVDPAGRVVGVVSRVDVLRVFLRSDESIRKEISNGLLNELPLLGRGRIRWRSRDGVVRLSGDVESAGPDGPSAPAGGRRPGVAGVENHLRAAAAPTSLEPRSHAMYERRSRRDGAAR